MCPSPLAHERARKLRWFGLDRLAGASMRCLQTVEAPGFKMQANDILASIGLASLEGIGQRLAAHRAHARAYRAALGGDGFHDEGAAYWFYPHAVDDVPAFITYMEANFVEVGQVHARIDTQPALGGFARGALPGLEEFARRQVNLPCGSHVSVSDREHVIAAVRGWELDQR